MERTPTQIQVKTFLETIFPENTIGYANCVFDIINGREISIDHAAPCSTSYGHASIISDLQEKKILTKDKKYFIMMDKKAFISKAMKSCSSCGCRILLTPYNSANHYVCHNCGIHIKREIVGYIAR